MEKVRVHIIGGLLIMERDRDYSKYDVKHLGGLLVFLLFVCVCIILGVYLYYLGGWLLVSWDIITQICKM